MNVFRTLESSVQSRGCFAYGCLTIALVNALRQGVLKSRDLSNEAAESAIFVVDRKFQSIVEVISEYFCTCSVIIINVDHIHPGSSILGGMTK